MEFGFVVPTHGVSTRDAEGDSRLFRTPESEMRPVELTVRAEELGYHTAYFADHIVTERETVVAHTANASGKRSYPERPILLDNVATMGAVASRTSRIRLSTGVYIAPYRHPLAAAHQFATLDVLSGGRVTVAVGPGWESGEFAALGAEYEQRGAVTEECIEVYKIAWTEPWLEYHGRFFDFADVSMDPKPVQRPRIPIWYGGVSPAGARRAARACDAFYPMFLDTTRTPESTDVLSEEIAREAERVGRDLTGFRLAAFCLAQITDDADSDPRFGGRRPLMTGNAEQLLEDIQHFADFGYSHVSVMFDCPGGSVDEVAEQLERFGEEVLPHGDGIAHRERF